MMQVSYFLMFFKSMMPKFLSYYLLTMKHSLVCSESMVGIVWKGCSCVCVCGEVAV